MAPALATYALRAPSPTLLSQVGADQLEAFLASRDADLDARCLPASVARACYASSPCGPLAHGLLRLGCAPCHQELLRACSCQRRGFCSSCAGRRLAQTTAHLVAQVIPWVRATARVAVRASRSNSEAGMTFPQL